jgi:hypothetical protein
VKGGYKEEFPKLAGESIELSFETPACQEMGLEAEELN